MTAESTKSSAQSLEEFANKQSKWSPEEDALIIDLRGKNMKWAEISKQVPGRSEMSCRLHYQNYLEWPEWDENKKNRLARMYERLKQNMWTEIAQELAIPWRAAEAMHWELGEQEMARRAGAIPFARSEGRTKLHAKRNTTHKSKPRHHSPKINHRIPLSPWPGTILLPPPMPSFQPPKSSLPPPTSSLQPPKHPQGQLRLPSLERLIAGDP
ncbi:hypothetical protein MPDQ_005761, partial [Monascus purpureus]